jgi:aryl-alcohol dehydrogenase-like predicted oxidoreductase
MDIQKRPLGKTGFEATIMGLGGEGVLRSFGYEKEAYALINRAIDLGINYFESARAYDDSESYYGRSLQGRRDQIFLTSKSHARDKAGALNHLTETLRNMKTDHLDLWQVHDVRTEEDIREIFGRNGALEAFAEAKSKGLTRFIGITGHHDPAVTKKCLELFDFDTVLMPVNPGEPSHQSFLADVLPFAVSKGMGIIGMKVYVRGQTARLPFYRSMEPFFRFALSQSVSLAVIGCNDLGQLEENAGYAAAFKAMSGKEQASLIQAVKPYAASLLYYKP